METDGSDPKEGVLAKLNTWLRFAIQQYREFTFQYHPSKLLGMNKVMLSYISKKKWRFVKHHLTESMTVTPQSMEIYFEDKIKMKESPIQQLAFHPYKCMFAMLYKDQGVFVYDLNKETWLKIVPKGLMIQDKVKDVQFVAWNPVVPTQLAVLSSFGGFFSLFHLPGSLFHGSVSIHMSPTFT